MVTSKEECHAATLRSIARIIGTNYLSSAAKSNANATAAGASSSGAPAAAAALAGSEEILVDSVGSGREGEASGEDAEQAALLNRIDDCKKLILEELGHKRKQSVMVYLVKLVSQPILSLRVGSLAVMLSLSDCDRAWALLLLLGSREFKTYLSNLESEHTKTGREWKFSLIASLHQNRFLPNFGAEAVAEIAKLFSHGPFYSPAKMEEMQTMEL